MRHVIPALVAFMLFLIVDVAPLAAQDTLSALRPGERVRVWSSTYQGIGAYDGVRADTLLVVTAAGERQLPLDSVRRLERSLGPPALGPAAGRGALVGGVTGGLAGGAFVGLILVLFCESPSCDADDWVRGMAVGAGVGGAIGAVGGGIAGFTYEAMRGERWERVPVRPGLSINVGSGGAVAVRAVVPGGRRARA
jgi:hypothetical protein